MRKWLILLSALSATTASSAPAWTWVDADGTVHFSDRPVEGARQIELAGAQAVSTQTRRPTGRSTTAQSDEPAAPYQTVDIVSPSEQETLWNIGGTLNVQARFQPPLQPGHRYDVSLDGQRRNLNATSLRVALPNVFRGTHTLQLIVLDATGTELMRSPTRNIVVQQTSLQNPNSAIARPAQRPGAN
jgi:hypothetical protein